MIAGRDVKKVYITDDYTATGIAGTAAIAVEFARLYAVELEHYEKLEGVPLTFAGDATGFRSWCAAIWRPRCRGWWPCPCWRAMTSTQPTRKTLGASSRSMPRADGTSRKRVTQSVGSGSIFAKSSIKKLYSQVSDVDSAVRVAVEALYDAADDDSATGGPDLVRGIYPTAVTIGADGAVDVPESRIAELARSVIQSRSRADTFGPDAESRGEQ